jgi:molybdate transport system ATP-binding protein
MGLSLSLFKRVDGFVLEVEWAIQEELAVLFGFSGAGKSMTLQMIAGLMDPDRGTITLGDKVLFDSRSKINIPPQDRSIGYVFQDLALFPHMTVRGNIAYGIRGLGKKEGREKMDEMIKIFHLDGLETKRPSEISGGQQHRVALARALIGRPGLFLLDEPLSALDSPLRAEMQDYLIKIKKEFNIPVILVTHDLSEAYSLAERIIVYSNGRISQTGSPLDVLTNPIIQEANRFNRISDLRGPGETTIFKST